MTVSDPKGMLNKAVKRAGNASITGVVIAITTEPHYLVETEDGKIWLSAREMELMTEEEVCHSFHALIHLRARDKGLTD